MTTELRFAEARTTSPASTTDWTKFIVDSATVDAPIPGESRCQDGPDPGTTKKIGLLRPGGGTGR